MIEILKITEVLFCVLLVLIILIQPKKSSLSITNVGNEGNSRFEKRGPEKILHNTTIVLGILFILNSLIFFFLA